MIIKKSQNKSQKVKRRTKKRNIGKCIYREKSIQKELGDEKNIEKEQTSKMKEIIKNEKESYFVGKKVQKTNYIYVYICSSQKVYIYISILSLSKNEKKE